MRVNCVEREYMTDIHVINIRVGKVTKDGGNYGL